MMKNWSQNSIVKIKIQDLILNQTLKAFLKLSQKKKTFPFHQALCPPIKGQEIPVLSPKLCKINTFETVINSTIRILQWENKYLITKEIHHSNILTRKYFFAGGKFMKLPHSLQSCVQCWQNCNGQQIPVTITQQYFQLKMNPKQLKKKSNHWKIFKTCILHICQNFPNRHVYY